MTCVERRSDESNVIFDLVTGKTRVVLNTSERGNPRKDRVGLRVLSVCAKGSDAS